jgi:hypothetical protein
VRIDNVLHGEGAINPLDMTDKFFTRSLVAAVDDHNLVTAREIAVSQRDCVAATFAVADLQEVDFYALWIH